VVCQRPSLNATTFGCAGSALRVIDKT